MPNLNEIPSLEDFALQQSDLQKETNLTPDIPSIEEFAKTFSPKKPAKIPSDRTVFQPVSDWSLSQLNVIQDFYKKTFQKDLPVEVVGQGEIQNKYKLDHRGSADVGLNPNSAEGKRLMEFLRENNIPFLAFTQAIPGVATGPHIHIGKASKRTDSFYPVGTILTKSEYQPVDPADIPSLEEFAAQNADIPSIEEFAQTSEITKERNETAPLEVQDLTLATDPNQIDFKVADKQVPAFLSWMTKYNKPIITGNNPYQAGDLIKTEFKSSVKPDINAGVDRILGAWNPEYVDLNARFRKETGGLNLLNVQNQEGFIKDLGDGNYSVQARPTRAAMALIEAYKTGGLAAYNATIDLINQQKEDVLKKNRMDLALIENYKEKHPYISAFESAFEKETESWTQLAHNLKYLAKASYTVAYKGGNSQDYLDLVNQEIAEQRNIEQLAASIYNPPSWQGKIIAGTTGGLVSLPRFILAGRLFGGSALPLMVYAENLHKGNREAALAALPMALMVGTMHGAGKFFASEGGTVAPFARVPAQAGKFTKEDLSLFTDRIAQGPMVTIGNLTPLERQLVLRGFNALAITGSSFLANPKQGLGEAFANLVVGLTFPVGKGPKRPIFPAYEGEPFRPVEIRNAPRELTGEGLPNLSQQLEQIRIGVPITKAPIYGKLPIIEQQRGVPPVLYPPAESPDVVKYAPISGRPETTEITAEDIRTGRKVPYQTPTGIQYRDISNPLTYVAETETGFQARGQGQTIYLPLDEANLNLLELKRALEEGTYKAKGDNTKAVLQKQQAIKNAISVLEQSIPEETKQFFAENEDVIRAALRSNYEAVTGKKAFVRDIANVSEARQTLRDNGYNIINRQADGSWYIKGNAEEVKVPSDEGLKSFAKTFLKQTYIDRKTETLKPSDIQPNVQELKPVTTGTETPEEIFGENGAANDNGTSQEGARKILDDLFKITSMGQRGSFSTKPLEGKGIVAQTKDELNYLSSFFIEDLYKRGIVPTVDAIANKIRIVAGDAAKYITDEQLKNSFQNGMNYYAANVADPFFSKMKQDVAEKLPKRFTVEQARNIIAAHKTESEWTAGLEDFLNSKEGQKINKQELIDVLNQGQVKVETSVASDEGKKYLDEAINSYREKYPVISRLETRGELYAEAKRVAVEAPDSKKEQDILNILKIYEDYTSLELPTYSLSAYRYEKLELPGAQNSKEVKLKLPQAQETFSDDFISFLRKTFDMSENQFRELSDSQQGKILFAYEGENPPEGRRFRPKVLYQSTHWPEPDVVAHYRANDRTTFDGTLRLLFGEEFQSDWAHDIREKGIRYESNPELAIENAKKAGFKATTLSNGNWTIIVDGKRVIPSIAARTEANAWKDFLVGNKGVEPMPFMQHNWKELVLKRFLRDAAVAKDENGNYKYDGVGWTTARQQLERYHGILEGKEFKWRKNSDGTYTFGLKTLDTLGEWREPHELRNISLERFAELTTPEAAQEVRDQESKFSPRRYLVQRKGMEQFLSGDSDQIVFNRDRAKYFDTEQEAQAFADTFNIPSQLVVVRDTLMARGQFSLKEAVELRSREGTYADYDVAYKNILNAIGKKFGAKYSHKEINTSDYVIVRDLERAQGDSNEWFIKTKATNRYGQEDVMGGFGSKEEAERYAEAKGLNKQEKIHYLEITPEMRRSLEKEGLPLYGTGIQEPLKSPEIGIRNQLTTIEGFNQHRDALVKSLEASITREKEILNPEEKIKFQDAIAKANLEDVENMRLMIEERKGTVFNSGLSPDAFIDQAKLLYSGIKDFKDFSAELIKRFGDQVKPFLQDLWIQVKELAKKFNEDQRGFLNLGREKPEAEKRYEEKKKKSLSDKLYYKRYEIHRGVMIAQSDPNASIVYDVARVGQRDKNFFMSSVLNDLRIANRVIAKHLDQDVAETIFIGNETQRLFTPAELAAGDATTGRPALNAEQIQAYNSAYKAEHTNLDKRLQQVLFGYRERANKVNERLQNATSPQQIVNLQTQLLDINDAMNKATAHFTRLKNEGYISLKRKGPIAAFVQDPAFPVGDKRGEVYRQFKTSKEAGIWVKEQEQLLNANPAQSEIYDLNVPERLRMAANKLTPGQFEELIDSSGVNPRSPDIEKLRDEIYSRYPSTGYELKRDYVRGYDRTWNFVLESIADQTEAYANSFYSRVAGEHMIKTLNATGLQQTNYNLYKTLQRYIDHEISAPERSTASELAAWTAARIRKGVYLFQLGGDVNQLYLNAIAQPVSQTLSYFSRVTVDGQRLKTSEVGTYWMKAWNLANKLAKDKLTGSNTTPQDFKQIYTRLRAEGVISAEFNKSLLELETEKTVQERLKPRSIRARLEHWSGAFMRAGEITTRSHAAAEAYLVGKEKFGLQGEELVNFIVRAVDATQSNPSRAEAPLIVRGKQNTGEFRKALYQFNAFNHMWVENLALNVKADFEARSIRSTTTHIAPVVIMGGLTGLPLSGLMSALAQAITGKDPRKEFHKFMGNQNFLERLALYGITTNATLANKLSPNLPFVEDVAHDLILSDKTLGDIFITSRVPAISTVGQIYTGFKDLYRGDYLRGIGGIAPIRPIRNLATTIRYAKKGVQTRGGVTVVPKSKITTGTLLLQGIGVSPSAQTEYYEKQSHESQVNLVREIRRKIIRKLPK